MVKSPLLNSTIVPTSATGVGVGCVCVLLFCTAACAAASPAPEAVAAPAVNARRDTCGARSSSRLLFFILFLPRGKILSGFGCAVCWPEYKRGAQSAARGAL